MKSDKAKILQKLTDNLELIEIRVEDVRLNPKNPKRHWVEGIKRSIKGKGLVELCVVDEKNQLLAGHGRLTTLKELGYEHMPAIRKRGLSQRQKDEYLIDSNKLSERGGWDMDLLADFPTDLLSQAGFLDSELDQIFKNKTKDDDFDVAVEVAKIKKPKTKRGEIYQLGSHRLMCGDATDSKDVAALMDGETANMVFTDPPYNVDYTGKTKDALKIKNDKFTGERFHEFLRSSLENMMQHCDGVFYVCMSSSELHSLKPAFEEAGGKWSCFIIWAKNHFALSRSDWQNQYEPILYGWNKRNMKHFFAGYRDEGNVWENLEKLNINYDGTHTEIKLGQYILKLDGEVTGKVVKKNDQVDIWYEKRPAASKDHPTMKPIPLISKALRASSTRGGIVLDTFAGSGSTLIAAEQSGRVARLLELDPVYCDVIIRRFEELTGIKAVKV